MPTLLPLRVGFARRCTARVPSTPLEFLTTRRLERPARLLVCLLGAMCLALQAAPAARAETIVNHDPRAGVGSDEPVFPRGRGEPQRRHPHRHHHDDRRERQLPRNHHLNSQLSGQSITAGTRYVNSENKDDEWYTRPPFPAVHTQTYDFLLVSQSSTPNYVLHMTMHETVTANGVPTAVVDNYRMDCQG